MSCADALIRPTGQPQEIGVVFEGAFVRRPAASLTQNAAIPLQKGLGECIGTHRLAAIKAAG